MGSSKKTITLVSFLLLHYCSLVKLSSFKFSGMRVSANHFNILYKRKKETEYQKLSAGLNSSDHRSTSGRIVNGDEAEITDHLFMVFILMCPPGKTTKCNICGGSILSSDSVVTAAHCVWESKKSDKIKECDGKLFYGHKGAQEGDVLEFDCRKHGKRHPSLDVAVIKLPEGREFTGDKFEVIKIGDENSTPDPGEVAIIAGWGTMGKKQDQTAETLQEASVKIAKPSKCKYKDFKPDKEICAGSPETMKDACTGDSGGPLECLDKKKRKYLCGVVSRGAGPPKCGTKEGVYVKITHEDMIDWLKENANAQVVKARKAKSNTEKKHKESSSATLMQRWKGTTKLVILDSILITTWLKYSIEC